MNRIRTMFLAVFAVVVLGGGLTTSPAFGVTYFPPITGFQDDDLDWHIDNDGDGLLSEGDRVVGVLEFQETYSVSPTGSTAPIAPAELTGVFDLTIVDITGNIITFGPSGAAGELSGAPAGTVVSLYLDSTPDLDLVAVNCGSLAGCIAQAADSDTGDVYLDVGFAGDADESWTAFVAPGGLDPSIVAGAPSTSLFGGFNYFLSVLTNNTGQTFGLQNCLPICVGGDGLITVVGSGNILGGQELENGAFARSDADTQVATVSVPEPSTFLLLGSGLLGLAFISRRRRKK